MTTVRTVKSTIEFGPPHTPNEDAELREGLRRYTADCKLLADRHEELLAKYEAQWVAICDGVLFSWADLDGLLEALRAGGCEPARAAVRYMTGTPLILIQR